MLEIWKGYGIFIAAACKVSRGTLMGTNEAEKAGLRGIERDRREVAGLTSQLDLINKEKIASDYADMFDEPKVQQAKYDEVISSKKDSAFWSAKIEAIATLKQDAGVSSYKPAQATNSWLQSRTKVAKAASEMWSL